MKKLAVLTMLLILGLSSIPASALTIIDTNAGWDGSVNNGWNGSGQSLTVDAIDNFFERISFYFDAESNGRTFDFYLSDALNGGNTLFSTSFNVSTGINTINIGQALTPLSTVYALIDYRGFAGRTAHFSYTNSYAGGQSLFTMGGLGAYTDSYVNLDHRFIAEFSGGQPIPEPTTFALLGIGFIGFLGYSCRTKQTEKNS